MVEKYNCPDFIKKDPVFIPHQFNKRQDIEISAFLTAILSWGKREIIINKSLELTENLRTFDPVDPVKYDFALFGMGVNK